MSARKLTAAEVGPPQFPVEAARDGGVFALSSHERAKEALDFGLSIHEPGFNIFVVGEDRSSGLTSTMDFLRSAFEHLPPPNDWVYLNNFRRPHRPKPYCLPNGIGQKLRDRMTALIPQLREALSRSFSSDDYQSQISAAGDSMQQEIMKRVEALHKEAEAQGLTIQESKAGLMLVAQGPDGKPVDIETLPEEQRKSLETAAQEIREKMGDVSRWAARRRTQFATWVQEHNKQLAEQAIGGLLDDVVSEFQGHQSLTRWLVEMRVDLMENIGLFLPSAQGAQPSEEPPERRYAVNLLVDNSDAKHPAVELEANPTYQNLFGRIEYRSVGPNLQTDFTMIRSGTLHRANGGVLVLRAEALAAQPHVWGALKGALRDRAIRVEELYRSNAIPMSEAPRPKTIPLDIKIVIIGAPRWYYTFFSVDPEFRHHFKVKAEIDPDLEATPENLGLYTALIEDIVGQHAAVACDRDAIAALMVLASRFADHREKLTSRVELIEDVVQEAIAVCSGESPRCITAEKIREANLSRLRRNARVEDRLQEEISSERILIDTKGTVVGQVNGLTVRNLGDHTFGTPARITARAFVGRRGIINIERDVELGGPIQQKAAMVLQGFLAGHFARRMPLSFNCSITFEQSYGGVEGDSASIAELLTILSDLSSVPLRQDLAVTGSVNQRGQSQPVGGVRHKIAGFFRTCVEAGGLTGTQGAVVPEANVVNLVLDDDIAEAVAEDRFHIYAVETVEQAIELFCGLPAGEADEDGNYPPDSVFGKALSQLEEFDRILTAREISGGSG